MRRPSRPSSRRGSGDEVVVDEDAASAAAAQLLALSTTVNIAPLVDEQIPIYTQSSRMAASLSTPSGSSALRSVILERSANVQSAPEGMDIVDERQFIDIQPNIGSSSL